MTQHFPRLLAHLQGQRDAMLEALETLVACESPSLDKARLDPLAARLAARLDALGATVGLVSNDQGGDHVHARFGPPGATTQPALLLGHYDTVWPVGTLERLPFRIEGGRAYGPGVFDMKASLVEAEFALAACQAMGAELPRPVELLITSDEEEGSLTSRPLIEETARRAAHVLVLEPPLADGSLKTGRKGVGRFTLEATGRAAHAGVEPEKGTSAVVELAHQVLAIQAIADPSAGTTLTVGLIEGGTKANVVPASARAVIDARAWTAAEARRVEEALARLTPVLTGASIRVEGGFNRPPMERTPAVAALYQRARDVGRLLGMELGEGSTGGGSDGNFTAALGIPTLDGLGVPGAGAHADHEQIELEALPVRAALLAALLLSL